MRFLTAETDLSDDLVALGQRHAAVGRGGVHREHAHAPSLYFGPVTVKSTGAPSPPEGSAPAVSVVVVSDYASAEPAAAESLARTLDALALQDFDEPVETLLVESQALAGRWPQALLARAPALRLVLSASLESFGLKNAGVAAAAAELIAILDADCVPDPAWLRQLTSTLRSSGAAAASGRTVYDSPVLVERVLGLLSRSYLDRSRTSETGYLANNNCMVRRGVVAQHPFPTGLGPFTSVLHAHTIRRAGGRLLFEPAARVAHAFAGWRMERDIRRNAGFAAIAIRCVDRALPYAWLARLGYLSIPAFVLGRTLKNLWQALRFGRHYGVRWYQLPLVAIFAVLVNALEVPGMVAALRGSGVGATAYR